MNPKTGKPVRFHRGVSGRTFRRCFSSCHQFLANGDCVDIHDEADYDGNENYLSEDGMSGISITKDGDLQSVFSLNKGFLGTIAPVIQDKCFTLDCFDAKNQHLPEIYAKKLGFETASKLDYNRDIQVEDRGIEYADYFARNYGEAPVHFMVNPRKVRKSELPGCMGPDGKVISCHFDKDSYDSAYRYQQALVNGIGAATGGKADLDRMNPENRSRIGRMNPSQLTSFMDRVSE